MNSNNKLNTIIAKSNIPTKDRDKNLSINVNKNTLMNKTMEGFIKLQTTVEKSKTFKENREK
jgi:hypothetical protein